MVIKRKIIYQIDLLILLFMVFLPYSVDAFQRNKPVSDIIFKISPTNKKAKYSARFPIKFNVTLVNNLKTDQEGTLVYTVINSKGEKVLTNSMDLRVNSTKKIATNFEVPLDIEGDYQIKTTLETNDYNETLEASFSYTGPPKKAKDRKNTNNPYSTAWAADKVSENSPTNSTALKVESTKDPELAPIEEDGPEEEGEIITKIIPSNKNGLYYNNKNIRYNVTLINKYKTKQQGTFKVFVKTDVGNLVGQKEDKIKISKRGIKKFSIVLPAVKEPGIYNITAALNVSTYDDTTYHAFGYKINSINAPYHKPPDFEEFWQTTREELNNIDPQYKITFDESKSTYFHTVYKVEINSLDNIPFSGWLSIPKPKGKYPVLVMYGWYKAELNPLYYDDFICFSVNVRGTDRKIDKLINPEKIPQLVLDIEDHKKYIYRGIYMDCIRAVEFIFSRSNMSMDLNRVITFGASQGAALAMLTAAMMPDKISAVVANNPVFLDWVRTVEIGKSQTEKTFPVKEMLQYEKYNKGVTIESMIQTLHYFDLQNFVPKIVCPVLLGVSLLDRLVPASTSFDAYNKLPLATQEKSDLYVFPSLGHEVPRSHEALKYLWFLEKAVKRSVQR